MDNRKVKMIDFVVTGRGAFPLDMLRHDCCWPASSRDVAMIDNEDAEMRRTTRTVKLTTFRPENITDARWASFLWQVGAA